MAPLCTPSELFKTTKGVYPDILATTKMQCHPDYQRDSKPIVTDIRLVLILTGLTPLGKPKNQKPYCWFQSRCFAPPPPTDKPARLVCVSTDTDSYDDCNKPCGLSGYTDAAGLKMKIENTCWTRYSFTHAVSKRNCCDVQTPLFHLVRSSSTHGEPRSCTMVVHLCSPAAQQHGLVLNVTSHFRPIPRSDTQIVQCEGRS